MLTVGCVNKLPKLRLSLRICCTFDEVMHGRERLPAVLQVTVMTFALLAQIIVFAHRTTPPEDRCDGLTAIVTRVSQRRRVGVTQVVEHHHRGVLGAPECVKLVVVVLARL